jgi:hypothetical protein
MENQKLVLLKIARFLKQRKEFSKLTSSAGRKEQIQERESA